jgi:hypothetical protein
MEMIRHVEAEAERDGYFELDDVLAEMDQIIADAEQARVTKHSASREPD